MNQFNSKIIVGFIIHLVLSIIAILGDPELGQVLMYIFLPALTANLIGVILIASSRTELGARVFLYSSIVYVPIGLIGIAGARTILNDITKKEFFN